jgi:preprotein translocase subunit SecY
MKKGLLKTGIGLFIVAGAIYGLNWLFYGYLIQETELENGTKIGGMRTPDNTDAGIFLILITLALIGLIIFVVYSIKTYRKFKRTNTP